MRGASDAPVVFGITGASGAPYAVRLLQALNESRTPVRLIVSTYGFRLLEEESGIADVEALRAATGDWSRVELYDSLDRGATPASGSSLTRGMVICPCSMGTLASIAAGTSRNLVERAADVSLKERRGLILVPRETPLSLLHIENMRRLALAGATILPASPGFYHRPQSIQDLVDFVAARILDHLGVTHSIGRPWRSGEEEAT
ncbi:MAG: UbiX family flavin prenyltransferase [Gemmatimonadetes bacterium]|nr:UbiX family flavin prenyltransferase [Gemmatimonadota bacterium]